MLEKFDIFYFILFLCQTLLYFVLYSFSGYHSYTVNGSAHSDRIEDEILTVKYDDGRWSKPYYDCGGGNIWMLTYTVPFFGYANDTYYFKYVFIK